MGVIPLAQLDPDVFTDPYSFKPERFDTQTSADKLIWPHGSHHDAVLTKNHICPGKNIVIEFGKLLCQSLLNGFDWELEKSPSWNDKKYSLNVALPEGEMRTTKFTNRV